MDANDVVANARDVGGYVRDRFEEFYDYDSSATSAAEG